MLDKLSKAAGALVGVAVLVTLALLGIAAVRWAWGLAFG